MMRETPKKNIGIFFFIDKIWDKMVHNHDHAGVKRGAKYAEGGGVAKLGSPPVVAPLPPTLLPSNSPTLLPS